MGIGNIAICRPVGGLNVDIYLQYNGSNKTQIFTQQIDTSGFGSELRGGESCNVKVTSQVFVQREGQYDLLHYAGSKSVNFVNFL